MEFQKVYLYYPNTWKRCVKDIADPEDLKFNWFLCSKRFYDSTKKSYIIEIASSTKFYEPLSGFTLYTDHKYELLDASDLTQKKAELLVKKYNLKGFTFLKPPSTIFSKETECILCDEVIFYFVKGILKKLGSECGIIEYAKRNNLCIKKVIPRFPSPQEIDDSLKKYSNDKISKILFSYMKIL